MPATFYVADSIEEAKTFNVAVDFDEDVQLKLYERQVEIPRQHQFIAQLDPFGDLIFSKDEVKALVEACDYLKKHFEDEDIILFAEQLKELCQTALERNKSVVALGD